MGGGGSGLAAAIAAVQAGASVIVLEKCGITGGSTSVSEGALNAVDPERQEPQGIEDSIPTFYETTMKGGIRVNVESEACNADGEPIPGLYAAGECTGGIHGENRLGGNAIADCMTFGRNAGTNAAKYALA